MSNFNLAKYILIISFLAGAQSHADESCPPKPGLSGIEQIAQFSKNDLCPKLKVGEKQKFEDIADGHSPTGIPRNYDLTRISDKKYKIDVPILFFSNLDPESLSNNDLYQDVMLLRAKDCFTEINKYLLGPNGESLEINIVNSSLDKKISKNKHQNDNSRQFPNFVEIGKFDRTNSENYEWTATCSLIAHEVFHLLGLVDEYPETSLQFQLDLKTYEMQLVDTKGQTDSPAYNCRAIGPKDSIMRDQVQALASVMPADEIEYTECICPPENASKCSSSFKNIKMNEKKCADGYQRGKNRSYLTVKPISTDGFNRMGSSGSHYYGVGYKTSTAPMTYSTNFRLKRTYPPKRDSLLYPAQFRVLTQPNCISKNSTYFACAANARRTSKKHRGEGCVEAPRHCHEENWLK